MPTQLHWLIFGTAQKEKSGSNTIYKGREIKYHYAVIVIFWGC